MQASLFRKGSKGTLTIGRRTYRGKIHQHRILIEKEPEAVFDILTDWDQFKRWGPNEQMSIEKVTPGVFQIGTRLHFVLRFRIQPEWDSEVICMERPHQIVNQFLNGIFEGGIEIWDLRRKETGTEVTHTLLYRIRRWVYKMGWFLLGGEKKHDELTEITLSRLKSFLEKGPL